MALAASAVRASLLELVGCVDLTKDRVDRLLVDLADHGDPTCSFTVDRPNSSRLTLSAATKSPIVLTMVPLTSTIAASLHRCIVVEANRVQNK